MSTVTNESTASPAVRGRTRVCVIGTWSGLEALVAELGERDDVEVARTGEYLPDVAEALKRGHVEAVLYVTEAGPGWLEEVEALRDRTGAPIVLLASARSGEVLDQALDAGVDEALLLPQVVENVAFALRRAGRPGGRPDGDRGAREGRVVTVFSPKGGIGKTVISTNLAATLASEFGRRTLLVDLDLQFGDTAILLGLQPEKTLHDLVSAPGELDPEKLAGYATSHSSGIDVLPAPLLPQEADLISDAKLAELLEVARATYDDIVVDSAPFLHGPILTALDQTSDLLVICSAEVPALKDVNLSLNTLSLLGFPQEKVRLIVNHAHQNGGLKRSEIEETLGYEVTAEIPNDKTVSQAVNRGVPAVLLDGKAGFTQAVRELGAKLGATDVPERRRSLFRALKGAQR
jgi:pilus assembly protein CpaE